MLKITMIAAALAAGIHAAHADIAVRQARYAAGVLVVRGEVRPSQRISLDRRYIERANRAGEFTFRIRYRPHGCTVTLRAGKLVQRVTVQGCEAAPATPAPAPRR